MNDSRDERRYGRKNIYTCKKCGGVTITIDIDDGVTPFMIRCRASGNEDRCDGMAQSCMYRVPVETPDAEWEWFKPTGSQYLKLSRDMREHVDKGGLDLRKIGSNADDKCTPAGYFRDAHGSLRLALKGRE